MILHHIIIPIFILITMLSCRSNQEKEDPVLVNGKEVYITHCISCHSETGKGIQDLYPSLRKPAGIDKMQTQRAIRLVKYGSGFENGMKPIPLTNKEIMEVINHIQNSWGNAAPMISVSEVEAINNL